MSTKKNTDALFTGLSAVRAMAAKRQQASALDDKPASQNEGLADSSSSTAPMTPSPSGATPIAASNSPITSAELQTEASSTEVIAPLNPSEQKHIGVPALKEKSAPSEKIETPPVSLNETNAPVVIANETVPGYEDYDPNKQYKVGDRIRLPLEQTIENPRNPRVFYIENDLQSLLASVASNGQLMPAQVYPADDKGKFRMKSGHRRRRVLTKLNKGYILVEVVAHGQNAFEEYVQERAINVEQKTQSHLDDALRWAELLDSADAPDQKTFSDKLGVVESELSKALSIAELPRAVLQKMAENIRYFGPSAAYQVFRFWKQINGDEARTSALVEKAISRELSVRQLEALVKESLATMDKTGPRREHALSRALLKGAGVGELKCFQDRLTLSLEKLPPELRDKLYQSITLVFKDAGLDVETSAAPQQPQS